METANSKIIDEITDFCLSTNLTDPIEMADTLMDLSDMPMISAVHHPMIAGVLVAAYRNATGLVSDEDVKEAIKRGAKVPAGFCAMYGTDGAAIATGIALSVILKTNHLAEKDKERSLTHTMTAKALAAIADNQGARCCKRSTWDVLKAAIQYFNDVLNVQLNSPVVKIQCKYAGRYKNCNNEICPYFLTGDKGVTK
jgi:hypothetical protein